MKPEFLTSNIFDSGKASVRGIAAFTVALAHAYGIFIGPHLGGDGFMAKLLGQAAHQSVMVFFIISGLLITLSIKNNIEKNSGEFDLIKYLSSRFTRIYPPLCFQIVISLFFYLTINLFELPGHSTLAPFDIGQFKPSRETFLITAWDVRNVFLMNNGMLNANGPLWSLYIEWRIYIFIGIAAIVFTSRSVAIRVSSAVVVFYLFKKLSSVNEHYLFYLSIWLLGAAYGILYSRQGSALSKLRRLHLPALLVVVTLIAVFRPELLTAGGVVFGVEENLFQFIIALSWCLLLAPTEAKKTTLINMATMWLGGMSYSLYILHFPTMLFVLSLLQKYISGDILKSFVACFISIGLSVLLSMFSRKYFERKDFFEGIIRRFSSSIAGFLSRKLEERKSDITE
jgi:peptidoglycan/LPS O-acetylase OafA/YrhL